MVSAILFSRFTVFGKTLTIVQWSFRLVYFAKWQTPLNLCMLIKLLRCTAQQLFVDLLMSTGVAHHISTHEAVGDIIISVLFAGLRS